MGDDRPNRTPTQLVNGGDMQMQIFPILNGNFRNSGNVALERNLRSCLAFQSLILLFLFIV